MSQKTACTTSTLRILGTHHAYQYQARRRGYERSLRDLIAIHSVDLIAEEATDDFQTFARAIVHELNLGWKPVELAGKEPVHVPDSNRSGIGTMVDYDFTSFREWVWLVRTARVMKGSALLICELAHTT